MEEYFACSKIPSNAIHATKQNNQIVILNKKSGIYKSIDSGDTWTLISDSDSGFPNGEGVGRIGLAVYDSKTIYAVIDNQFRRLKSKKPSKTNDLTKNDFESMSNEDFLNIEESSLNSVN